jgi:hypothetical protein
MTWSAASEIEPLGGASGSSIRVIGIIGAPQ